MHAPYNYGRKMQKNEIPNCLPDCKSVRNFLRGFHTESTKETYSKKLSYFLDYCGMAPDRLLSAARKSPRRVQNLMIDYVEERKGEVSGSTLQLFKGALRHFFEMNDVESGINWAKISKMIPHAKKTGNDRAPSVEEIRRMVDLADLRTKCVILICATSGIRVGAFDGMTYGDLVPVNGADSLVGAKVVVYRGEREQYTTFVTSECYGVIREYVAARRAAGENLTGKSPLIRDAWDNNAYRKTRSKDPSIANPVTSKRIANMMGDFLKRINLRGGSDASGRYEFKQIHGFRKYFKTNAERTMKTLDVEKLMGHTENYYKPSEDYLREQYNEAAAHLVISESFELRGRLEKQITVSDKKMGELERENASLQDRLDRIDDKYDTVREILDKLIVAKIG